MPIYAYRCEACDHELEALQKISDAPLTECPACGKPALKKQITAAAFRLKGAGWYETDFKKDGKKNLHDGGDKPKEKTAGGADKGESKSADKPAAKETPAKSSGDAAPKKAATTSPG
jgi:putative FmdB family regulatory protein